MPLLVGPTERLFATFAEDDLTLDPKALIWFCRYDITSEVKEGSVLGQWEDTKEASSLKEKEARNVS